MRLLSAPLEPASAIRGERLGPAAAHIALTSAGVAGVGWVVAALGPWSPGGRALQQAAVHGGLLALALLIAAPRGDEWRTAGLLAGGGLLAAACLVAVSPWGGLLYAAPPLLMLWQTRRVAGRQRAGFAAPSALSVALGLAVGAFLGAHLLLTASLTFGYTVGGGGRSAYLGALAYDMGANALTAACFFYGALFSWLWRRLEFWRASAAATGLGLLRYLLDPALPPTLEGAAGAVLYLIVLGMASCALRAATGSVVPAYAAGVAFFAGYRALGGW